MAEEGKESEGGDGTKADAEGENKKEVKVAEESRKEQAEEQPKEEEGDRDPGGVARSTMEPDPAPVSGPSRGLGPKHMDTTEAANRDSDEKTGQNGTYSISNTLPMKCNDTARSIHRILKVRIYQVYFLK